jgi:uncharacterized protein (DUF2267 family)
LRLKLLKLNVEAVEPVTDREAPPGTPADQAGAVGELRLLLARSSARDVLEAVIETVRIWLRRASAKSVRLQFNGDLLEISRTDPPEHNSALDEWLARQTARPQKK